jgi:hypothetical protein
MCLHLLFQCEGLSVPTASFEALSLVVASFHKFHRIPRFGSVGQLFTTFSELYSLITRVNVVPVVCRVTDTYERRLLLALVFLVSARAKTKSSCKDKTANSKARHVSSLLTIEYSEHRFVI